MSPCNFISMIGIIITNIILDTNLNFITTVIIFIIFNQREGERHLLLLLRLPLSPQAQMADPKGEGESQRARQRGGAWGGGGGMVWKEVRKEPPSRLRCDTRWENGLWRGGVTGGVGWSGLGWNRRMREGLGGEEENGEGFFLFFFYFSWNLCTLVIKMEKESDANYVFCKK